MGFFSRTRTPANLPSDPASTLGRADTISARGNAIAGRATEFYKQNPKLLGGLALVASALLLNRMKRPR